MTNEKKEIFSEKVQARGRTYFFEVEEAQDQTHYLIIRESNLQDSELEENQIRIYEENIPIFLASLKKGLEVLGIQLTSYSINEIRQKHSRAYEKWTIDEDEQLRRLSKDHPTIEELTNTFQRQPGAIKSRLAKLGLLQQKIQQ